MLQMLFQILAAAAASIIAYMVLRLGAWAVSKDPGPFMELDWFLERTPALDVFLMFVLGGVIAVSSAALALKQVSNHSVITLDILFFTSLLMLVLYHVRKVACTPPISI